MKIDTEKRRYWEGRIADWVASGLTQRAFCEREGLKRPTFDYWRRRIKPEAAALEAAQRKTVSPMTLVPVRVARSGAHAAPMELHGPGTWRLLVPASVDVRWLAVLMKSLA